MELRHLRYFVAVVEEGHFGRAAKRLHMAQPPLSRQIKALEDEIGFALFDRSRRRIEVTPAGEVFLGGVRQLFGVLDGAVRDARRAAAGELGRISIGYPSSVAYSGITKLLRTFRDRSPAVEIVLREMPPQEQVTALKEGRIDVGFVRGPLDDPTLATAVVRRDELMVALPKEHPLAAKTRVPLAALARERFITFPRARGPSFFDFLMRLCHEAGFTPDIVQEAPQLDILTLVAAGFGVGLIPSGARTAKRGGLVLRSLVGRPRATLLVTWRKDEPSPVVADFLEVTRRVFRSSRGTART